MKTSGSKIKKNVTMEDISGAVKSYGDTREENAVNQLNEGLMKVPDRREMEKYFSENKISLKGISPRNNLQQLQEISEIDSEYNSKTKNERKSKMNSGNSYSGDYSNFSKKINNKNENTREGWRNININSLISECQLLNSSEDDMLYQGELFKLTNASSKTLNPYMDKFCIITRTDFR